MHRMPLLSLPAMLRPQVRMVLFHTSQVSLRRKDGLTATENLAIVSNFAHTRLNALLSRVTGLIASE